MRAIVLAMPAVVTLAAPAEAAGGVPPVRTETDVRVVQHITEDNTVRNTVTGLTLPDSPVDFVQTSTFDPETGCASTSSSWARR